MRAIRRDFLPAISSAALAANGIDGCIAVQADQSDDETRFLLDLARPASVHQGRRRLGRSAVAATSRRRLDVLATTRAARRSSRRAGRTGRLSRARRRRPRHWRARSRRAHVRHPDLRASTAGRARADRRGCPDQPFVLDHLGKPAFATGAIEPWAGRMRELARRPNVCCKLSGLVTEADWSGWQPADLAAVSRRRARGVRAGSRDVRLRLAGVSRRRRRTSACVSVDRRIRAELSADERAALFGGNAARVLRTGLIARHGPRACGQGRARHRRRQGHRRGDRPRARRRRRASPVIVDRDDAAARGSAATS